MAIFDLNDFNYRRVVKLAPDAFISINGAFGGRLVSPLNKDNTQTIDIQGGIISINTNSAVNPPGSGRASIQIVAPEYAGLQTRSSSSSSGYWVTLPSGVKIPYFLPMMEVQVFMKGRFLYNDVDESSPKPVYYRSFWGFITNITEDYNAGLTTLSLQCSDMLEWWRYQKLTVSPNEFTSIFTSDSITKTNFPTIFRNRNPWQIITQLLYETQWLSPDNTTTFNWIYPKLSNISLPPYLGDLPNKTIGVLAVKMQQYWRNRFNFFGESMQIEMFGLTKQITDAALSHLQDTVLKGINVTDKLYNASVDPDIGIDYNLLARVQPFADFNLFGLGAESLELTKLEIAQKVCEQTHMEFYVDLNGIVVFKPPFYNLDVTKGNIPYYVIDPGEVISYSSSIDTHHIVTYLELTAPSFQPMPNELHIVGLHIDWELMMRYGMRVQKGFSQYGNDAKSLSLIAAGEMARINAEATTGHVSIPLRPEIRMGYPVYIVHKDVYFYISGITHSFSFGSAATTDLTLTAKRERVYDATGEFTASLPYTTGSDSTQKITTDNSPGAGRIMRGFVQKFTQTPQQTDAAASIQAGIDAIAIKNGANQNAISQMNLDDPDYKKISTEQEDYLRAVQAKAGPKLNGWYQLVPAETNGTKPLSATETNSDISNASGPQSTIVSNQLMMITKDTIPYTDIRGYRHIGGFPYGANLMIQNNLLMPSNDSPQAVSNTTTTQMIQDPKKTGAVVGADSASTVNIAPPPAPKTGSEVTNIMMNNTGGTITNQTQTVPENVWGL